MFAQVQSIISQRINQRFDRWLTRRVPKAQQFELSNRNIFIFPSSFGLVFLFVVLLLFLLGTNYQNNVIILLSYLMASFFITCTLAAFFNVKGLVVSSNAKAKGFNQQVINIELVIKAQAPKYNLSIGYRQLPMTLIKQVDQVQRAHIVYQARQRGIIKPGRVKIVSEYPFGLFRVWSWLDFDHEITVYPAPKAIASSQLNNTLACGEQGLHASTGNTGDEFYELRAFQLGESMSRVAWKQLARGQGKLTKHYQEQIGQSQVLSLDMLPPAPIETRLSYLCYLILQYSQTDTDFGLSLPNQQIAINHGDQHKHLSLTALARYPYQVNQNGEESAKASVRQNA
ncbi:hypothetical protein [Colwellia sp. MEBiC06753]